MGEQAQAADIDLLVIGPATRDLLPGGGWRLGGTVLYGALTAVRLGLRVGVVTRAPADVLYALRAAIPEALVAGHLSEHATTFENVYDAAGARTQYLRGRGEPLAAADVPTPWRRCAHAWLAPLAHDVQAPIVAAFAPETRIAATPQGWLRRWDGAGRVQPGTWTEAATVLPRIEALILSDEDLRITSSVTGVARAGHVDASWLERDSQVTAWRTSGSTVVVTQGERGATLLERTRQERFPAHHVACVDPTGAGDVFAAAFLRAWWWGSDVRAAVRFANAAASFVVERGGTGGIPTYAEVAARLGASASGQ